MSARPYAPACEVRNTITGETGVVIIDLGDNVSVWVERNGERTEDMWRSDNIEAKAGEG